jgi:hypothetical protein
MPWLRHEGKSSVSSRLQFPIHFSLPRPEPPRIKICPLLPLPATNPIPTCPGTTRRAPPALLAASACGGDLRVRSVTGAPITATSSKPPNPPGARSTTLPRSRAGTAADWVVKARFWAILIRRTRRHSILARVASRDGVAAVQRGTAVPAGQLRQRRRDSHAPGARRWSRGQSFGQDGKFTLVLCLCELIGLLRLLLRQMLDWLQWIDKEGKTPLMLACMRPDLFDVAKVLIELGANVNAYRPGILLLILITNLLLC